MALCSISALATLYYNVKDYYKLDILLEKWEPQPRFRVIKVDDNIIQLEDINH